MIRSSAIPQQGRSCHRRCTSPHLGPTIVDMVRDVAAVGVPRRVPRRHTAPMALNDPLASEVTEAIRSGDAAALQRLLNEHPDLAGSSIASPDGTQARTLLHVVCDWPGHVPEAAPKIRALVAAGAHGGARFGGPHDRSPPPPAAS